ncbi:helicase C-terminal domain-containing protein [Nitrosospira briensis]|uniref:helicase C-terminal domain-containing protein n=1 Tax=Nitrosospira briensis TaxID=35799 RepID=UPI0009E22811|nr:helicase C-terminal domain-containing protein [Nitrosospira briensis]
MGKKNCNASTSMRCIQKVVQATGRVIRTHLDQGVINLIDDRLTRPEVLRLLPDWWKVERYKTKRQDNLASLTPTQEIKPLRDSAPSSLPII